MYSSGHLCHIDLGPFGFILTKGFMDAWRLVPNRVLRAGDPSADESL